MISAMHAGCVMSSLVAMQSGLVLEQSKFYVMMTYCRTSYNHDIVNWNLVSSPEKIDRKVLSTNDHVNKVGLSGK